MDRLSELLILSATGDTKAFQQLYELASPRLFALCKRLVREPNLAEEVLQEGFIKIWRHAAQFSASKASAMTWMTTLVRNQALDALRQAKDQQLFDQDLDYETLEFASPELSPDKLYQCSDEAKQLQRCLALLKPEQRQYIMQAFYYGYTHEELAQLSTTPLGTVKAWIRRGLEQLRGCLQ